MEGFYMGFLAKQTSLCDCQKEDSKITDSDSEFVSDEPQIKVRVVRKKGWCNFFC
jgi:hypothetical protein